MTHPTPDFETARTLFFEGIGHLQNNRLEEARSSFEGSLQAMPGRASTQTNLAATLLRLGRAREALEWAERALATEPSNPEALFQAAHALQVLQQPAESLRRFEELLALGGCHAAIHLHHAQVLHRLQRPADALAAYGRAVAQDPQFAAAWTGRGEILRELGRAAEAAHSFEQAIHHGDDSELTRYCLASVRSAAQTDAGGTAVPAAAPKHYVEALFDSYADEFDEHLVKVLGYKAHKLIAQTVAQLAETAGAPFGAAADLGCGTGLCGALIKPRVARLTGVDLSSQMIEKTRERGLHDELVQADIVSFLAERPRAFELLVGADVLIYLGELTPFLSAARIALAESPRSTLCFSLEEASSRDGIEPQSFLLQPSLRYAHTEQYVRHAAEQCGFTVRELRRDAIRQDQRESIPGLYVTLVPG
jgi:predicted TPR repeat methyltransferase